MGLLLLGEPEQANDVYTTSESPLNELRRQDDTHMTSRDLLDARLRLAVENRKDIRILQIGACDGRRFDPVYRFISTHPAVSGVFIEPISEYFRQLVDTYKSLPGATFLNFAVSDFNGFSDIRYVDPQAIADGVIPAWAVGISTMEHRKNAIDGIMIDPAVYGSIAPHVKSVSVPVVRLQDLLHMPFCATANVYLSDCEGHDFTLFSALKETEFRPDIFFLESMLMSAEELSSVKETLFDWDYIVHVDKADLVAWKRPRS
ncbi:hypothetical protein [Pseudarthrobacter sp. J47]|uniref:hypothetical protein n=1 Tax=Pseudarthrobacter sp. J47 TaxID=3116482 RepID=UPI002E805B51|nr:hypothetical protein [Pseudarthrobacter sp. J47]MEE2524665.1 hypothetical protein [Pseudarthrobacter sp. J47]